MKQIKSRDLKSSWIFDRLLDHDGGDEGVEGLAVGGQLLHLDKEADAVADELEELDFPAVMVK
jgi:hypothetical protein